MLSKYVCGYTISIQEIEEQSVLFCFVPQRFKKCLDYSGDGKSPDLRSTEHGSSYSNTELGGELQLYVVSSDMTNPQVTWARPGEAVSHGSSALSHNYSSLASNASLIGNI